MEQRKEETMDATTSVVQENRDRYLIDGWGAPYFSINALGNVDVRPDPNGPTRIDLNGLGEELRARGLEFPVLVRFPEIIHAADLV